MKSLLAQGVFHFLFSFLVDLLSVRLNRVWRDRLIRRSDYYGILANLNRHKRQGCSSYYAL